MAVSSNTGKTYSTEYNNLKGIDLSSGVENVYKKHSPTGTNMISDVGGSPKKRNGWERVIGNDEYKVEKTWSFSYNNEEHLICHLRQGNEYYLARYLKDKKTYAQPLYKASKDVVGFYTASDIDSIFNVITLNDLYEFVFEDGGYKFRTNAPYVPTISIGGNMQTGGGTSYESVNILANEIVEQFLGSSSYEIGKNSDGTPKTDGTRDYVKCDHIQLLNKIDKSKPLKVTLEYCEQTVTAKDGNKIYYWGTSVDGGKRYKFEYAWNPSTKKWEYKKITYEKQGNTIAESKLTGLLEEVNTECYFSSDSAIGITNTWYYPIVGGEDNVKVQYYFISSSDSNVLSNENTRKALLSCNQTAVYENRTWLTGADGEFSNRVWYSSSILDHDAYYPDTNYVVVGSNDTGAKGLVNLGEYLGVVKEPSATETTIYLLYSTTYDNNTAYACKSYVSGVGALGSDTFCNVDGESLFLSSDGIYGLTTSKVKNRSYYVNKRMTQEVGLENAVAVAWNGYYILCVNYKCYILDTRQKTGWGTEWTNYIYECYFWDNIPSKWFSAFDGTLYFIHYDGSLCRFRYDTDDYCFRDDIDTPIFAEWSTPLDNDGSTQLYKTLQKKGTVCTIKPFGHTSVDMLINADDVRLVNVGRHYGDTLDFGDIWFDEGRFTFKSNDAPLDCFFKKKVKKYKRLQFILRNEQLDEPFMVEAVSKTYTVHGYSKRKSGDGVSIEKKEK